MSFVKSKINACTINAYDGILTNQMINFIEKQKKIHY